MASERVNVTLDAEHAQKLARMAERVHVSSGTLARSLLSEALDQAEPDSKAMTSLLDSIPGAYERVIAGREAIARGEGLSLDEFRQWRES